MDNRGEILGFWLMPEAITADFLQSIITKLADENHAASFMPHVTLFITQKHSVNDCITKTQDLSNKLYKLELEYNSICASEVFTESVFADFKFSHALEVIHNCFKIKFDDLGHNINPHLSLLYSNQSLNKKTEIKHDLLFENIMPEKILFDEIKLIRAHLPVKSNEDVASWEILESFKLNNNSPGLQPTVK